MALIVRKQPILLFFFTRAALLVEERTVSLKPMHRPFGTNAPFLCCQQRL
ncbi:hypothetical protein BFAG_03136 [Bacteroides fragilis 3_1_12]|uniref:Uncharacterized protein n=1 Tax=Bacteroides fragilis 3_1_12 TaxID=457424 RepID=A0ABN0BNB3_BACFG|nr:hypothetical protein BFAG_03136 [Bacteroides fragilis 3_1_12]